MSISKEELLKEAMQERGLVECGKCHGEGEYSIFVGSHYADFTCQACEGTGMVPANQQGEERNG